MQAPPGAAVPTVGVVAKHSEDEPKAHRSYTNYPMLAEHDPMLESVRGDDRFKNLMVRVKKEWEEFELTAAVAGAASTR